MQCKFPYFEQRPHIPLILEHQGKRIRVLPLLDTGADFSIFYKPDAIRLGLNWKRGKKIELANADGSSFKAKEFTLTVVIENYEFKARICFCDNNSFAMPLLGRRDIFNKFIITIDDREGYVRLQTKD